MAFDPKSRIHSRKVDGRTEQEPDKVKSWATISTGERLVNEPNPAEFTTIPLLANRPLSWSLTEGVNPSRSEFAFRPEDIPRMEAMAEAGPVTLTIFCNNQTVKVENLWITDMPGSSTPHIASVVLSDRRCWWSFGHLKRLYNVMRPIGLKRLDKLDGIPKEIQQKITKFRFIPGSLNPPGIKGEPWEAEEIIEDVLEGGVREGVLFNEVRRRGGRLAKIDLAGLQGQGKNKGTIMPIFDFEVDASSEVALTKALQQIPGAGITVDLDGTIRVFRRFVDLNKGALDKLGPEIDGEGHQEFVKNKYLRPKQIEVFFTCEAELRFDFREEGSYRNQQRTIGIDAMGASRTVDNVLPVPDYELKEVVERGSKPFTAVQGTWISIDAALEAWNNFDKNGAFYLKDKNPLRKAGLQLDYDFLQRAFPAYVDLWTGLLGLGAAVEGANWPARIAMLKKHYRQTWRINRRWMDQIDSLRARRVAIMDFGSGTRGPSPVWTDYSVKATQRSYWLGLTKQQLYGNVEGGLEIDEPITNRAEIAPVNLVILDHDQGIVSTQFVGDVNGVYDTFLPGKMAPNLNGNYAVIQQHGNPPIFANAANESTPMGVPRLAPYHRSTFIISAVPSTPNNNTQLKKITVTWPDIQANKLLPPDLIRGGAEALGPPLQLRVGAGVEVARIAWNDDKRRFIENLFGNRAALRGAGVARIDDLIINLGKVGKAEGGASLWDIALGLAATTYASYADRWEGSAAGHLTPDIRMEGFTESVRFELRPDGAGLTVLNVSPKPIAIPFTLFLGQSTRNILSRLPQVL